MKYHTALIHKRNKNIYNPNVEQLFAYWLGFFNKPLLHIIGVKSSKFSGQTDCETYIRYNTKLHHQPLYLKLSVVLHEIGHVVIKMPYNTISEKIKAELCAETFALEFMKKYYSNEYKKYKQYIKKNPKYLRHISSHVIYFNAFIRVPEYTQFLKEWIYYGTPMVEHMYIDNEFISENKDFNDLDKRFKKII